MQENISFSELLSAQTKLTVVAETLSMCKVELSQYCRQKRLSPEQVHQWRTSCLQSLMPHKNKENEALKKELQRKEKALSELLVVKTKLRALCGEEPEDH